MYIKSKSWTYKLKPNRHSIVKGGWIWMWVSPPLFFFLFLGGINKIALQPMASPSWELLFIIRSKHQSFLFKHPDHLFDNKKLSYLEAKQTQWVPWILSGNNKIPIQSLLNWQHTTDFTSSHFWYIYIYIYIK